MVFLGDQNADRSSHRTARPPPGAPGRLPIAKIWRQDSVTYEAEVVCYDGSLYQALKDTAQVPLRSPVAMRAR